MVDAVSSVSTATTTNVVTKAAGPGKVLQTIQIVDAQGNVIDTQDVYIDSGDDPTKPPPPVIQQNSTLAELSKMLEAYSNYNDILTAGAASPAADTGAADRSAAASQQARTLVQIAQERRQRELRDSEAVTQAREQAQVELRILFDRHVQG